MTQHVRSLPGICPETKMRLYRLRKTIPSLMFGICFLLLPNTVGCGPIGLKQPVGTQIELFHDFGDISKDQKSKMLSHEFTIRNRDSQPMTFVDKRSSCSCVLFQEGNDDRITLDVPPHNSIQVRVGVSVQSKVGQFVESITLSYVGVKPVKYLLQLRGLILSSPMPVVDKIRFDIPSEGTLIRECLCSYQRKKEQQPIHLVDARVLVDSTSEPGIFFDVKDSIFNSMNGANTTVIETWRIPIELISRNKDATKTSWLKLAWSDGSTNTVQLIVESQNEIEVLQSQVMVETNLGKSYTTFIPVRFAFKSVAEQYEVCSDADWCRAMLDVQKQAIEVSVDGRELGSHKCILSLRYNRLESCQVEVECVVKAIPTAGQLEDVSSIQN